MKAGMTTDTKGVVLRCRVAIPADPKMPSQTLFVSELLDPGERPSPGTGSSFSTLFKRAAELGRSRRPLRLDGPPAGAVGLAEVIADGPPTDPVSELLQPGEEVRQALESGAAAAGEHVMVPYLESESLR